MKRLIAALLAVSALGGCVAVPAPYSAGPYYYPAPAVGVEVYPAPVYYRHGYYRHHRW